jgi:predicted transcriptional regulator
MSYKIIFKGKEYGNIKTEKEAELYKALVKEKAKQDTEKVADMLGIPREKLEKEINKEMQEVKIKKVS